jgi:Holliday junction resolvase RusA-like endonuclease
MWLDIIPIAKGRPRIGRNGPYTPDKTRCYERQLKLLLKGVYKNKPDAGPIVLSISFYMPLTARSKKSAFHTVKPDLDNLIKAFCDAANGILWNDDAQVCRVLAGKMYDTQSRRTGIEFQMTTTKIKENE